MLELFGSWLVALFRGVFAASRRRDELRRDLYVRLMASKLSYHELLAQGKTAGLSNDEVKLLEQHMMRVHRAARMGVFNVAKYEDDEKDQRDEIEAKLRRILRVANPE